MTQIAEQISTRRETDARIIGLVSAAHFISHYYILLLPPLFAFVRADYGVSYTEIGFALAAFNIVSAAFQTPAGFLVDRLGARGLLIAGLALGAAATATAALIDSFWVFVVMFGFIGLANTVYHPADYAILSHRISSERMSRAFSIHTFCGQLGSAAAPASLLLMQTMWGWRGAYLGAALIGAVVAVTLLLLPDDHGRRAAKPQATGDTRPVGWKLLLSTPILLNLAFFTFMSVLNGGLANYSVVALGALYATPASLANTALTAYLLVSAFGVLAGGAVSAWTSRHGTIAALGLLTMVVMVLPFALFDLGNILTVAALAIAGFSYGIIMPARDMIVRDATPPGSFGKVFGFVTTGFNIGGIASPFIFGAMMDYGAPSLVFVTVAGLCVLAVLTVISVPKRAH